ncbi:MAG: prolipoprotein diacylglyceryl transferase [Deltaproteobacteria bacterium]|nr:prolipoprotein diacylglyceryl transferase [Deltaproteobacteria bacterium]
MYPVLVQTKLFGLLSTEWTIHTYGVFIAAGFLLALFLASRRAKLEGEDYQRFIDLGFYVLLVGFIGGRLLFMVANLPLYIEHPIRLIKIWYGGFVWYGSFISAALFIFYYSRKHRIPFFKYADIIIPYMALAHAIGRIGCFAAGCCYGAPTQMPWGVSFPIGSLVHQAQQSTGLIKYTDSPLPVHPTQLYESLVEFALFVLLIFWRQRKMYEGQLLVVWLLFYGILRAVIEQFRGDNERGVFILSTSQYVAIIMIAIAIILHSHLQRQQRQVAAMAKSPE